MDEGGGSVSVCAVVSNPSDSLITYTVSTADGAATAPDDYTALNAPGRLFPRQQKFCSTVEVTNDMDREGDEDFTATLSNLTNATLGSASTATITILASDPEVTIAPASTPISEENGPAEFTLTRTAPLAAELTVNVTVSQTGAFIKTADSYTAPTTVTFGATEATATLRVELDDDAVDEDDGAITATVAASTASDYAVGASAEAVVVVEDDDAEPALILSPVPPVGEDAGSVSFTVRLDAASGREVRVDYATADETAVSGTGNDYTAASGTLTFAAGDTEEMFTVAILEDQRVEEEEVFTVSLTNPVNATLAPQTVTVTITDNDEPVLTLHPVLPVGEDAGSVSFTVRLNAKTGREVTVDYATENETAVSGTGNDYTAASGTLTFVAGDTEETFTVAILEDQRVEEDEVFLVRLTNPQNATVGSGPVTVTITDNDEAAFTVSVSPAAIVEAGGSSMVTVDTGGVTFATAQTITLTLTGTATEGTDYTISSKTLTLPMGQGSVTATVTARQDDVVDAAETVIVTASHDGNPVGSPATITITDDDTAGVRVSETALSVDEGRSATYTVRLNTQPTGQVTMAITGHAGTDLTVSPDSLTFTSSTWSAVQTVRVTAAGDDDGVADAVVTLVHDASGGGYGSVAAVNLPVTIVEDDEPGLVVSRTALTVREGETGTWTVALATEPAATVTVAVTSASAEVTVSPSPLSFTAADWDTAQTVTVTAEHDSDAATDPAVPVTHDASGGDYGAVADVTVPVTVTEDDTVSRSIALSLVPTAVPEGGGAASLVVTGMLNSAARADAVEVSLSVQAGTATATEDYTAGTATLTIEAGELSGTATLTLTPVPDTADEPDETVTVRATTTSGLALSPSTLTVTIEDDDDEPALALSPLTPTVGEDGGSVSFTATLGAVSGRRVTVRYATADGSAVSGSDYTAASGTLTFAAGDTAKTFTVGVRQDSLDEDAEDFTVTLSDPVNATMGAGTATVTITDDDAEPALALSPTAPSVEENAGSVSFTVRLDAASGREVTVDYATADGSAVSGTGNDYTAANGTLTFAAGDTTETFTVAILEDPRIEGSEDFTVRLTNPGNATLGASEATVTITDNDAASFTLAVSETAIAENAGTSTVTVGTGGVAFATNQEITLAFTGTATEGTDYTVSSKTLTLTAGQSAVETTITAVDDRVDDEGETIVVEARHGGSVVGSRRTITITDDDTAGVRVSETALSVDEGSSASYTVRLNTQPTGPVTVAISGQAGTDLTVSPDSLTFTSSTWSAVQTVRVTAAADDDGVADAVVTLRHAASGADYGSVAAVDLPVTIVEADEPGLVVSRPALTVREGETGTWTVALATEPAATVTVAVTSASAEVTVSPSPLTFTAADWDTAQTVTVTAEHDSDAATDPAVTVTHDASGGDYGAVADVTVPVTVTEDDTASTGVDLSVAPTAVPEGGGAASLVVTGMLNSAARVDAVEVSLSVRAGTATETEDYTAGTATLTIEAGETSGTATVTLTPVPDTADEPDETVTVRATTTSGLSLSPSSLTVTIEDDDDEPRLILSPVPPVAENAGSVSFTVRLDAVSGREVQVDYATTDGTAVSGNDYTAASGTLTFAAGETVKTFTVAIRTDGLDEDAEDFTVRLTNPVNATLELAAVTVTITDVNPEPALALSPTAPSVQEDAGSVQFTVSLSAVSGREVRVDYETADGSAVSGAGNDYTAANGTLTFAAGDTAKTFTVAILEDQRIEGNEDFTVALKDAVHAPVGTGTATVTITDNDAAAFTVTVSPAAIVEAGGSSTVTVDTGGVTFTIAQTITLALTGTATEGTDYTISSKTLTLPVGQRSVTATVTARQDDVVDADETVIVTASHGGSAIGTAQTITITDDDTAGVRVSETALSVDEGNSVSYTVRLNTQPTGQVTVTITGQAGTDLTVSPDSLTFTGSTWDRVQTVRVTAAGDDDGVADAVVTLVHAPSGADYGSVADVSLPVTIVEADAAGLVVSRTALTVREGETGTWTVALATEPTAPVTVAVTSASAEVTVSPASLRFTAADWKTAQTVTVTAEHDIDAVTDPAVTVTHDASGGDYGAVADVTVPVTVTEDDRVSTGVDLSVAPTAVTEGGGAASLVVTGMLNSAARADAVEVSLSVQAGTATETDDYTAGTATLTIEAGELSGTATVTLTPVPDTADEPDETVTVVAATTTSGLSLTPSSLTVTITDDDDEPALALSPLTPTVGEDAGSVSFTATLGAASGRQVTVRYATADGTAAAPGDYTAVTNQTLTFAPGDTEKTFTVAIGQDSLDEDAEDFTVTLSDPVNATVGAATATVTITDDDAEPALALSPVTPSVGEDAGSVSFTVRLDAVSGREVTVDYATADGSAVSGTGNDYTAAGGTLTFAAGDTTETFTVAILEDQRVEGNEDFTVRLSAPVNATLGASEATVTITDNNAASFSLAVSPATIAEAAGTSTVTVGTGGIAFATDQEISLAFTGTATEGTDYTVSSKTLTLTAGQSAVETTITARDDRVDDEGETIVVEARHGGSAVGSRRTITITDDDEAAFTVAVVPARIAEAAGTSMVTVETGGVSFLTEQTITLSLSGTATEGTDYTVGSKTLTLAVGDTEVSTTVTAVQDRVDDDEETIVVEARHGGSVVGAAQTITITDDDAAAFTVTVSPAAIGEAGGSSTVTVDTGGVTFTTAQTITLGLAGTATEGTDYTISSKSLRLALGQRSVTATVTARDDNVVDIGETVVVTASHDGNPVGSPATITINDDDTAGVRVSETALSVDEGSSASYTVRLNTQPTGDVTVTITGHAGTDLTVSPDSLTFTGSIWSAAQTVRVTAAGDDDGVANAVVTLRHAPSGADYGSVADVNLPVTIVEADEPGLVVSRPALTVREGETGTWTVALATEPTAPVTVAVTSASAEVTVSPASLRFTAADWEAAQTVTVTAEHDIDAATDPAVTVTHDASGGDYGAVADVTVPVTVTEDDTVSRSIALSLVPTAVPEGGGAASLVVTGMLNSAARADAVEVSLSVQAGTATATEDYTAGTATLTIEAGELSGTATVTLTPVPDTADEPDETVTVRATTTSGLSLSPSSLTVTIEDDDLEPELRLSPLTPTVGEDGGSVSFTATLGAASGRRVTVRYATADGSAVSGSDYTAAGGTLTFAAGDTAKTFTVGVRQDQLDEDAEDFTVTLSDPVNATLAASDATATVTITDDDAEPALALSPVTPSVQENAGSVSFTVRLDAASGREVRVDYATADGSAVSGTGNDYTAANGRLTFAAGDTAETFTVAILEDQRIEGSEDFTVRLTNPGNATLGASEATVTITDNDAAAFTLAVSETAIAENAGESTVTVGTGGIAFATNQEITLAFTGTATKGTDYTVLSETLTLTAGQSEVETTITATDDRVDDEGETIVVEARHGGSAVGSRRTITITDDDEAAFTVTVSPARIAEDAGTSTVTVDTGGISFTAEQRITLGFGGTATKGTDYTVLSETLTLAVGGTEVSTTVTAADDRVDDDEETIVVEARHGGSVVGAAQTITITDDDEAAFTVTVSPAAIGEAGGSSTVTVDTGGVTFTTAQTITLGLAGTATEGTDYTISSKSLRLAVGQRSVTATVTARQDDVVDIGETVVVTASHDGNTVGSPATITITDDDTAGVRVSETALSVDEGRSATYTVRLNTQPTGQVTMAITGHAGTELTVSPDSLTFTSSNWSAMQTVRVTAAADDDGVADAVVTLVHDASGGDYGSVADVNLPVTIVEDDAPGLVVSRAALTVREGETGTWTVALATEPTAPVTVAVTSASAEVTVSPSPLTFTAADWETAQTVTVTAEPDTDAAQDEAVPVTHDASGGDYGAVADVTVPVTVTEGDTASTGVDLSVTPTAVTEDGGAVDLVVTGTLNSAARTDATEVSLSVQAGTATVTEDYTAGTATLTIEAGELSGTATVTLTPVPDTADEPDETVTVVAATTTSGLSLSPSTLTVTIEDDDDEPALTLSPLTPTVGEGAGSVPFTATLGAASGRQVTVRYATADGSAVSGSDYTSRSGTLTFGAGETAKTFTVAVRQDRLGEDAEDFTVTLSDPVNATVGAGTATVTITDDEALTVAVTARDATVTEGGAATFPVALSGGTGTAAVVVTYTVTGGTATAADYTAPSGTLRLEAGDTAGEITIQTTLDTVPDSGETLVVTLSGARTERGAVTVAGQPATTTIVDAGTVTVGVAPATVTEGGTLSFAVTLSGTVASDVTVGWTTRDGTGAAAARAGADYTAVSGGTLTIAKGDRAGTLEVRTLQDTLAEEPETFTVTLTATDLPAGVTLAPATAAGTIIDDDGVTVGVAPAEATEGGTLSFAVTLSGQVSSAVVLGWTTADGTATADTDYMAVSGGTLTIAEGDRAGTLEVQTFQDTLAEEPETFTVTLTGTTLPAGVTLAPATATGTIIDDDGVARTEITVGVAPAEATEGGTLSFAVTLSGQVSSAVVLGWTTADGTATADTDYMAVSGGTLTIAEGDRAGTLEVQTLQDTLAEEPETFTVTISAGPGGLPPGVVLGRAMATGTIINAVPRNRPPVFTAARYTFDLPENRDGRVRAMALGTVAAPDPDGDAVTYGLAAGDRDRFAIDPGTGAFTYVGPGEDFEAGPTTYDLTVRASDAEGAEATASIVVTVTDGNEAPAAVGVIPDQALEEGGAPVTLDLAPFFDDVDGDRLTFAVVSSDPAAATAEVAGATLTLTAVVRGAATVTVTARDAEGSTATQVFGVTVGDRLARAATGDALAALGRGYLSSARLTIGRRLEAERPGTTQVTVAGQRVPLGVDEVALMGQATAQRWLFGAAAAQQRLADDGPGGSAPTPGLLQQSAGALPFAGLAGGGPDRMLQGTDILLAFGGGPAGGGPQGAGSPEPAAGAPAGGAGRSGGRATSRRSGASRRRRRMTGSCGRGIWAWTQRWATAGWPGWRWRAAGARRRGRPARRPGG